MRSRVAVLFGLEGALLYSLRFQLFLHTFSGEATGLTGALGGGWGVKTLGKCTQAAGSGCFKSLQDIWLGGAWPGLFSLYEAVCRRGRGTAVSGSQYLHIGPLLFANIGPTSSSSLFCYLSFSGKDRRVPRTKISFCGLRRRNTTGQPQEFFLTVRAHC